MPPNIWFNKICGIFDSHWSGMAIVCGCVWNRVQPNSVLCAQRLYSWCLPGKCRRETLIDVFQLSCCSSNLTLHVCVARLGRLLRKDLISWNQAFFSFSLLPQRNPIGLSAQYPPSSHSWTIPSLRPPAWELLGNQNQLLVLSPLSQFWSCVNCRVVFSESSLWTQRPPLRPWHHRAMENLPHFLLFSQFYCSSDTGPSVGASPPCITPVWVT